MRFSSSSLIISPHQADLYGINKIGGEHMPKKVLIFCDPGIDDTMALLLAFFIDEIEIVGIVADYGNVPKKNSRRKCSFF